MNMFFISPAYIDPGTGSMLFSILIGAAATGYFVFRALIIKLKMVFSGGSVKADSGKNTYVIYCEGKQYINVFSGILAEFEKRGTPLLYLTSVQDDAALNAGFSFVKAEYIGEGNRAFARLNLLSATVVLMTTPGLDVYQLKRSKMATHYAHILHATSDATMYRLFGLDYFDSVLLTGDYQAHDIRALETERGITQKELVTVGCTYLDNAAKKMRVIESTTEKTAHNFTVLVSPSWGASGLLTRYGEKLLSPLAKTGWRIIVRPHPQSKKSESEMLKKLEELFSKNANVEWDYNSENIFSLAASDIMISDFSGIIYDYTFLCDKPVIYVNQDLDLRPYDADDLYEDIADEREKRQKLWQFSTLQKIGIELKEDFFDDIKNVIEKIADNAELKAARKQAKSEAWFFQGESAKHVADFMIHKARVLESASSEKQP
ncbi:MAG: CDP-glycerol glycerophosphotransferase family protein [Treponemataceae bacterium]|nr:MAG: CDP-glycerol glycerophosphotransferase family protein [Treponemataceae bacterium]